MKQVEMGPYRKLNQVAEDEQRLLELSPRVHYDRPERAEDLPSPWNTECISRLVGLFVILLIGLGFVINRLPVHMKCHDHQSATTEQHHHVFHEAAVAAGQLECSVIGTDILRAGGNAVDSAIATILCQGVVEPYYSGIGGGFGMTIYNHTTKTATFINAREVAPAAATHGMFNNSDLSIQSVKYIAVPGELKGIDYAYKKYGGGVSWHDIFEPAIKKARDGFKVSGSMAQKLEDQKKDILNDKVFCDVYCDSTRKRVKREGETVKNPLLAGTLTRIQKEGVDVFYKGDMAATMAREIQEKGGILTAEDFNKYEVSESPSLKVNLPNAGYTIHAPPLPFGGPVFGAIMSIMDRFNVSAKEYEKDTALQWHRTVEAFRHAYGARYLMGDPKFHPSAREVVRNITSGRFAREAVTKIYDNKTFHDPKYYGARFYRAGLTSTSHMSILAPNKDCVSVTSTINYHFGSLVMSPSTGLVFNNEMADFSYPDGDNTHDKTMSAANQIEPGKHPLSSMSPVVFSKDGRPVFIIGAAGGIMIPTGVADSMLRLLYFGTDDFDEPIRQLRLHDNLVPDVLWYEKGYDKEILDRLREIGHNLKVMKGQSHVNGIKNHDSHIHAFSDLRNLGAGVDGF